MLASLATISITWDAIGELVAVPRILSGRDGFVAFGLVGSIQALVAVAASIVVRGRGIRGHSGQGVRSRPQMSVREFRRKWNAPELKSRTEEALRHEFLLDLLQMVGIRLPAEVDPGGLRVAFEYRVMMPGGTPGYIDLLVDRCAVEVKRPGTPLQEALIQLRGYSTALPHLSALIATNFYELVVYPAKPMSPSADGPVFYCTLDSLDRRALKVLRLAFIDPERLFPGRRFHLLGRGSPSTSPAVKSGRRAMTRHGQRRQLLQK